MRGGDWRAIRKRGPIEVGLLRVSVDVSEMLRERVRISRERRGRVGTTGSRFVCVRPLWFHVPLTRPEDPRGLTTTLDGGPTHKVPGQEERDLVEIQNKRGDVDEKWNVGPQRWCRDPQRR